MRRPDLNNRLLVVLVAGVIVVLVLYFWLVRPLLPVAWRTPGSPTLYVSGVLGALLLLVSMAFVVAKRTGRGGSPQVWFIAHVVCATLGSILIAVHSAGFLRRPPALLFLALLFLAVLGVWARLRGSRQMAATFANKQRAFAPVGNSDRSRLAAVISRKRELLRSIEPQAVEGTFSLTLSHWIRAPRSALAYARLVREESVLVGNRASVGSRQAYWRPLHLVLAYLFVLGILIHVITVTFFAGYVADGGAITWWHLTEW